MNWVWVILASLCAGALGAMGMGGGGILIIYLTVWAGIAQQPAQGMNLLLFLPCAALALLSYTKKGLVHWKTALWAALGGLPGALAGALLSNWLDAGLLRKIFGLMLAVMAFREFFSPKKQEPDSETHGRQFPPNQL